MGETAFRVLELGLHAHAQHVTLVPTGRVDAVLASRHHGQASVTVAHVGDSRVYLARPEQPLRRLTTDHGYFHFAVRHRHLGQEEAWRIEQVEQRESLSYEDQAHFERRHQITCAVGRFDFSTIPVHSSPLLPGDRVILCTDGLHDNSADWEIEAIVHTSGTAGALHLVHVAFERSLQRHVRTKRDDISAIVAWYPSAMS